MHNEYWKKVWEEARDRLDSLYRGCDKGVDEVIGDDNFIDSYTDARRLLTNSLLCAETCEEKACAILSVTEALHALHELNEGSNESPVQVRHA